jgi:hypothetical protein
LGWPHLLRWLLDDRSYASVSDIRRGAKLDRTYVGDVLRLRLLASEIVEAIVHGRQGERMALSMSIERVAIEWETQRTALAASALCCQPTALVKPAPTRRLSVGSSD